MIEAGAVFRVAVTLSNLRPLLSSYLLQVQDQVSGPGGEQQPKVLFMKIGPGERRTAEYQLRIIRRGTWTLGPLKISSQFPLGIGEKHQTVLQQQTLTICPAPAHLLSSWRLREDELAAAAHSRMRTHGAAEDEFYGIREYRSGDNHRAVHWHSDRSAVPNLSYCWTSSPTAPSPGKTWNWQLLSLPLSACKARRTQHGNYKESASRVSSMCRQNLPALRPFVKPP
jgi:hypothetical protein